VGEGLLACLSSSLLYRFLFDAFLPCGGEAGGNLSETSISCTDVSTGIGTNS